MISKPRVVKKDPFYSSTWSVGNFFHEMPSPRLHQVLIWTRTVTHKNALYEKQLKFIKPLLSTHIEQNGLYLTQQLCHRLQLQAPLSFCWWENIFLRTLMLATSTTHFSSEIFHWLVCKLGGSPRKRSFCKQSQLGTCGIFRWLSNGCRLPFRLFWLNSEWDTCPSFALVAWSQVFVKGKADLVFLTHWRWVHTANVFFLSSI